MRGLLVVPWRAGVLAAALLASAAVAGCSVAPERQVTCVSWADFPTAADRSGGADAVVVVDRVAAQGTEELLGLDANTYRVRVSSVEKGEGVEVGQRIRVVSTADGCSEPPYGEDGDPMLQAPPLRLYLTTSGGLPHTLTPFDGVSPV